MAQPRIAITCWRRPLDAVDVLVAPGGDVAPGSFGHAVEIIPAEGARIPGPDGFDMVLAMGAPWSMDDTEITGWIGDELALLRTAVDRDVPVLGACFGAQALSTALGGEVGPGARGDGVGTGRDA